MFLHAIGGGFRPQLHNLVVLGRPLSGQPTIRLELRLGWANATLPSRTIEVRLCLMQVLKAAMTDT